MPVYLVGFDLELVATDDTGQFWPLLIKFLLLCLTDTFGGTVSSLIMAGYPGKELRPTVPALTFLGVTPASANV